MVAYLVRIERSMTSNFSPLHSISVNSISKKEKHVLVFSFDMASGGFVGSIKNLKADDISKVFKIDELAGIFLFIYYLKINKY